MALIEQLATPPNEGLNFFNDDGLTPLYWAANRGHTTILKLLLQHHADPNLADQDGKTPLYLATRSGRTAIVECLLQHGVSLFTGGDRKRPLDMLLRKPNLCATLTTKINNGELSFSIDSKYRDALLEAATNDNGPQAADFIQALLGKIPQPGTFTKLSRRM